MNYRRITVGDETFDVRISDHGFREWLNDRERLAGWGDDAPPDRPPDVDSETLRAWVPHPGEEGHPYFAAHPIGRDKQDGQFPVVSFAWHSTLDASVVRFLIIGNEDGSFIVQVAADAQALFGRQYPKEMGPDAVWTDIEEQVIRFSESLPPDPAETTVRITTYTDYELFDAEIEMVQADIERQGFVNPLPEGPVQ